MDNKASLTTCRNCTFNDGECTFYDRALKLKEKNINWCNAKTSKDVTKEEVRAKIKPKVLVVIRDGNIADQKLSASYIRNQTVAPVHTCIITKRNNIEKIRHKIQGINYSITQPLFEDFPDNTAYNLCKKYKCDYLLVLNAGDCLYSNFIHDLDVQFNDKLNIIVAAFAGTNYLISSYFYLKLKGNLEKSILEKLKDINVPIRYDFNLQS